MVGSPELENVTLRQQILRRRARSMSSRARAHRIYPHACFPYVVLRRDGALSGLSEQRSSPQSA